MNAACRIPLRQTPLAPLWWALLALLSLLLVGCPHRVPGGGSGQAELDSFRQAPSPQALKAHVTFKVEAPSSGVAGSTSGAIVIHRPSRLFVQVQGPMGGVLLEMMVNEKLASVRLPQKGMTFQGRDPEAMIRAISGDTLGVDTFLALLTGHLPLKDLQVIEAGYEGDRVVGRLQAAGPYQLHVRADPKKKLIESIDVKGSDGRDRLRIRYHDLVRVGRDHLPGRVDFELPEQSIKASVVFRSWDSLGQVPDLFEPPQDGLVLTADLADLLRRWLGTQ